MWDSLIPLATIELYRKIGQYTAKTFNGFYIQTTRVLRTHLTIMDYIALRL